MSKEEVAHLKKLLDTKVITQANFDKLVSDGYVNASSKNDKELVKKDNLFLQKHNWLKYRVFVIALAVLGMIATFMPWVSTLGFRASGASSQNWITFILFGLMLMIIFLSDTKWLKQDKSKWMIISLSCINGGIALAGIIDIEQYRGSFFVFEFALRLGIGLPIILICSIMIGLIMLFGYKLGSVKS